MIMDRFPAGGVNIKDADAAVGDVIHGKTFYSGAKPRKTGTLQLTGDAAAGHVLSGKGFYNTDPKTKLTGTIPSKAAQTYTPGTANQTIAAGQYLSGEQTIAGDADLIAGNIRAGKNIFGVDGTLGVPTAITAGNNSIYTRGDATSRTGGSYGNFGLGRGFTAIRNGAYRIQYNIITAAGSNGMSNARLTKNGVAIPDSYVSGYSYTAKSIDISLSAGDEIRLQGNNPDNGTCYNVYFIVSVEIVGLQDELINLITPVT